MLRSSNFGSRVASFADDHRDCLALILLDSFSVSFSGLCALGRTMLAGRQLLVLYIISSLCSCQHAGADGADLVQIRLQHDRETNSTKKYVFMGAGIANNGYTGNKWLGLYNLGVQGCYDAIMADTRCNKDYFTYSARYDLNCGCKITSGRLIVDSNKQFDYYRVQTPLAKTAAHLKCPAAWTQVGPPNADVAGCGLEACGQRYGKKTITECATFCASTSNCASFTWAPKNGDRNHMNSPVCTMYKVDTHTGIWSPKQIMCKKTALAKKKPKTAPTISSSPVATFETTTMQEGMVAWTDRSYTYKNVPRKLVDAVYFRGTHSMPRSTLTLHGVGEVCAWYEVPSRTGGWDTSLVAAG